MPFIKEQGHRQHISGFDNLRILAAFAVVWIHGSDTNRIAHNMAGFAVFAVPVFLLISIFLTIESLAHNPSLTFPQFFRHRVKRLMPAYLVWTVIYLLVRWMKHAVVLNQPLQIDWPIVLLCGGAAYQLWFVPALLYWSVCFFFLFRAVTRPHSHRVLFYLCLLLALGSILACMIIRHQYNIGNDHGIRLFFAGYMLGNTGFIFVAILAWLMWRSSLFNRLKVYPLTAGVLLLCGAMAFRYIHQDLPYVYCFAIGLFICALYLPSGPSRYFSPLAKYSFGIYLAHGVFVEGFQVILGLMHINGTSFPITISVIFCSFLCSLLTSAILYRQHYLRWIVC